MMATRPKRVLIVEDNPIDSRLFADILIAYGYEITQAADGLEAIDLAWSNPPDLILMDIRLRDISGLEIVRRLRDDDRSKQIPIVAVTALAQHWVERAALESGCNAYLSKPISIHGLLDTIESLLSQNLPTQGAWG